MNSKMNNLFLQLCFDYKTIKGQVSLDGGQDTT